MAYQRCAAAAACTTSARCARGPANCARRSASHLSTASCRSTGRRGQVGAHRRQKILERLGIVEHDFRTRNAGDEIERGDNGFERQIRRYAEPLEIGRLVGAKAGGGESLSQALPLEIDRRE